MSATTNQGSLVFAGIAPHPPIMVPEVGGVSIAEVLGSINAMVELTRRLKYSGAETVVLISPHAPLEADSFVAYSGPELHGDFSNFSAPQASFNVPVDENLLQAIIESAAERKYEVNLLPEVNADHGTAVPLYFLLRNGWQGRVVALGYSFLSSKDHLRFGESIRSAVDQCGRRVAFVASGDLSHRLKPRAPAGYNPNAHAFDEEVVGALQSNDPQRITNIDPEIRKLAGECGYRSMLVAIGATGQSPAACEVISYEAPFGVGYLVGQLVYQTPDELDSLHDTEVVQTTLDDNEVQLPHLARLAVETFVRGGKPTPAAVTTGLLAERAPCFVSLKTRAGELRGCIGTIEPSMNTLGEEIVANAVRAAIHDPRFPPVTESELADLRYSVDVLFPPEPVSVEGLDPQIYGVIVEDEGGVRRGLLLPDIPGVESVEQQVQIAARKAGIPRGTPLKLSRFRVQRFRELSDEL